MAKRALIVLSAVVASLATAAPTLAAPPPDRTGTVTPEPRRSTWTGPTTTAANTKFDPERGRAVRQDGRRLLRRHARQRRAGRLLLRARARDRVLDPPGSRTSTCSCTRATPAGRSATSSAPPPARPGNEGVSLLGGEGYYLLVVVYFAVTNAGYEGSAEFFRRNVTPFDIDDPRGLQDTLASDPGQGWRSRSEMHVAQSPTDPDVLVGASKFYNRDPDSLPSTSSRSARTRRLTGRRAGPTSGRSTRARRSRRRRRLWPLGHTCYPADNPARAAPEPRTRRPQGERRLRRGATSRRIPGSTSTTRATPTRWRSTRRRSPAGNGWGMSFHRWESVSREDVRR